MFYKEFLEKCGCPDCPTDIFQRKNSLQNQEFVDSKLNTKFGLFNIRVYAANQGKETVVLWTENLNTQLPVLVRPHSECFTGDLLGSLHCDCGRQLIRSLELIKEHSGVLIYLRQEGRGIGLFEKIKAYRLQSEGLDTFDANVHLGHLPDERSYEMVKIVLEDLNIQKVRLITNNPNKVSEIAKYGIEVVEQVPIITKSNIHNKRYLLTKKEKFNHFLDRDISTYFYQFHIDTVDQLHEIGEFCRNKKKDPFLQILVGIAANSDTLKDEKEINRIRSLFEACNSFEKFIPVLHFSFSNSLDSIADIRKITELMPFVKHLQINDLVSKKIRPIIFACQLFSIYLPLSDENFDFIHNRIFRSVLKKHKAFLVLDNSKGRGIQEPKESLMKKIDILLNYGLNNIGIFGGFGPNELDIYFDLRRFYKLNFSIDSETKIKSNGTFDTEKIKLYLFQLIRFDDPKPSAIEQTRVFLKQHQLSDWDKLVIEEKEFLIHPKVFHAGHFPSSLWFAKKIRTYVKDQPSFCEVGCGSGIISCLVAADNPNIQVIATDINPFASENTKLNAQRLKLSDRIHVVTGDVLDAIPPESSFDFIFWSLPFGYLDPGISVSLEEMQVFDPGYRATRKFFQTAKKFLKPGGQLLIGFSSELGNLDLLQEIGKSFNLKFCKIEENMLTEINKANFELLSGTYEENQKAFS